MADFAATPIYAATDADPNPFLIDGKDATPMFVSGLLPPPQGIYKKAREKFLLGDGTLRWVADTVKVFLIRKAFYTVDLETHEFLSSVPTSARAGNSGGTARSDAPTIGSRTGVKGLAGGANVSFSNVPGGAPFDAVLVFADGGSDGASRLIAFFDKGAGLPITPRGVTIILTWSGILPGLFQL